MINSCVKGKVGEREVAELLREFGFEAKRGQQHAGGADSPDVIHSIPGWHIEVKRTETLNVYKAIEQAGADNPLAYSMVLHRRNRKPWLAVVNARALLALLAQLHKGDKT